MEKATSNLELVDLSKQNFRRTLDSLQEGAHSLLLLNVQWNEIEGYFDSTKTFLTERAKELEALEESLKGQALELEAKEKELCSTDVSVKAKMSDLEMKEKALVEKQKGEVEQLESLTKRVESMEKFSDEKMKELDARAKELGLKVEEVKQRKEGEIKGGENLRVEFEPLVSLLAKRMGSSVTIPTNCSASNADFADDLVKKNIDLSRLIPYLDPAKLVLDAIQESFKEYLEKDFGESDDRFDHVVNSIVVLLEKLIQMNPKITPKVKKEATKLGINWIIKAKANPDNHSQVIVCLFFMAAYGLASVNTREVLLNLLEHVLLYDHAPKLFRLLGLKDKVPGVVEGLIGKEEYLAAIKFICEFKLYILFPQALLLESLISSEKDVSEAQKAKREKIKANTIMALEYIKEKKLESKFPLKAIKSLVAGQKKNKAPRREVKPVRKSDETGQNDTNIAGKPEAGSLVLSGQKKAKRQRSTEPIIPIQIPTVNQQGIETVPAGDNIEESRVNNQPVSEAAYPLSTETDPNISSGSINVDILRELVEKQPLEDTDLSNALKFTPDSAKLALDTSMGLYPLSTETNPNISSGSIDADILRELVEKQPLEETDLSNAIKSTPDSAKLVLDTSMGLYPLSTETNPNISSGSIDADILRELVEKQPLEETDLSNAIKSTPDSAKLVLDTSMALYPLSTETNPNNSSGSINADILRELVEKQPLEESVLSDAIKSTPDSAKLVLDTSMALCPTNTEGGFEFKLLVTSASCSLLLDQLKKLPPQMIHPVKGDAKKLAGYWKDKVSKNKTDELEVICFLNFLGIFGVVSEFEASELLVLLNNSYWRTVSPDLCKFLGLDNAIPDFIQNLIKTGHRLKAIDYIYSFDMVHRFQPVSAILNDFLRIRKESAEKAFQNAKNESAEKAFQNAKNESGPLVRAIDRQIVSLRAAIKRISCYKLESEFQVEHLKEQIKSLFKLKRSLLRSRSKTETAKQPNAGAEVGSVTSNTALEPSKEPGSSSVSEPRPKNENKRGHKRRLSGNIQSSVHVPWNPSNHFHGHGYSLNQTQTWPDHYYGSGFTGTPNSGQNHNQWGRQPERPQFYNLDHRFSPLYRSPF